MTDTATTTQTVSYATVGDLEERWRALSPDERSRAATLLLDASAQADVMFDGIDLSDKPAVRRMLTQLVCAAVQEAMCPNQGDAFGLGQVGGSWEPSNPSGIVRLDWRMVKDIKAAIGRPAFKVLEIG